jgi:REP element-mobilizing transposase RayT
MTYNALRRGRHSSPGQAYAVTAVCAGREPVFLELSAARVVIAEMRRLHDLGHVNSLAFVVMPDHLHWLFELGEARTLHGVLHHFKGRTARSVNRRLGRHGALWQKSYYDYALRREDDVRAQARYIVANPLRAGLVPDVGQYPHWDAVWLADALSG